MLNKRITITANIYLYYCYNYYYYFKNRRHGFSFCFNKCPHMAEDDWFHHKNSIWCKYLQVPVCCTYIFYTLCKDVPKHPECVPQEIRTWFKPKIANLYKYFNLTVVNNVFVVIQYKKKKEHSLLCSLSMTIAPVASRAVGGMNYQYWNVISWRNPSWFWLLHRMREGFSIILNISSYLI